MKLVQKQNRTGKGRKDYEEQKEDKGMGQIEELLSKGAKGREGKGKDKGKGEGKGGEWWGRLDEKEGRMKINLQ